MYARQNPQYPVPAPQPEGPPPPAPVSAQTHNNMMQLPSAQAPTGYAPRTETLQPLHGRQGDRTYSLVVEQQPIRARMCGFGDKDRRPITPPPCIRLIVRDAKTGKEVDFSEVDSTFFVLTVDLWDADGTHEVNLVRHSGGPPAVTISNSNVTSYPPPVDRTTAMYAQPQQVPYAVNAYGQPIAAPPQHQQHPGAHNPYGAPAPPPPMPSVQTYYSPHATANPYQFPGPPQALPPANYAGMPPAAGVPPAPLPQPQPQPQSSGTGMFTRNLIGSLSVNAFRLTDTQSKIGFWFVLQDLSVRTEGVFRLKMNFVDVGSGQGNNTLNTGRAPVLATCFSEPFQVFSAKKFPGVIESTPLSKAFATQGIKIPIRKDAPKQLANQAEYDEDDR